MSFLLFVFVAANVLVALSTTYLVMTVKFEDGVFEKIILVILALATYPVVLWALPPLSWPYEPYHSTVVMEVSVAIFITRRAVLCAIEGRKDAG